MLNSCMQEENEITIIEKASLSSGEVQEDNIDKPLIEIDVLEEEPGKQVIKRRKESDHESSSL